MAAEGLIADKAFDADERVREPLAEAGKTAVIPPRSNRKQPPAFDRHLYKERHLIDIDQTWRLSRIKVDTLGFNNRERQAAPRRRRCPDLLQPGNRGGIGGDQLRAAGASFDGAAA